MKRIALIALFVLSVVLASRLPQIRAAATGGFIEDHCVTGLHQNAQSGSISSATTTSLIAPVTGMNIYICHVDINQAGGASTSAQLEYGTGATCGTGTQVIGPLFTASTTAGSGANINIGGGNSTIYSTNAGLQAMVVSQRLCVLSAGSTVQSIGVTFVQE